MANRQTGLGIVALAIVILGGLGLLTLLQTGRSGSVSVDPGARSVTPVPSAERLGMVIRDPWYDFGTAPDQPDAPNYAAQDRMGALLSQMGVRWVRFEFQLVASDLTVEKQLARNDYFIREVAPRYNLKILGLLGYGLIRGQDPRILVQPTNEYDPTYGAGVDNARRIWLDRARMIAERYQGDIAAYEILNEPNRLSPDWNDTFPASELALLQATFYRFFHHIDRADRATDQQWRDNVQIILGAIHPAGVGQIDQFGYLSERYYLRQLYASAPFQTYVADYGRYPLDGLAYHPYPQEIIRSELPTPTPGSDTPASQVPPVPDPAYEVDLIDQRLDEVRAVLAEIGDPNVPFWITEIGYNAAFQQQNATLQADFLRRLFDVIGERDDIAHIFWFKYEDFPPAEGPNAQKWGTVRIPFVDDPTCAGGACYETAGYPTLLRPAFWVYRELAGVTEEPEHPAQAITRGPLVGRIDEPLTFRVQVERPSATQPLTYTWQFAEQEPLSQTGTLETAATFSWPQPGRYRLRLEVSNAAGTIVSERVVSVYRFTGYRGLRKK